ncbi:MAG: hypothetical protein KDE19_20975, partial [Caldilineaceae bacterium]|nr:hypothetical protein [Caldilineaceae bacterium]
MTIDLLIDQYCLASTEPDPATRATILNAVYAANATYTDPMVYLVGIDELLAHIAKMQDNRPGAKIVRTSRVDLHHGVARFAWHLVRADGTTLPEGVDIAFVNADGAKIERIIGFFGPLQRDEM